MTKILCMYLPQFHETDYNNEWWGKGYTEWQAVKGARKLFKGHSVPNVPLNNNYYDLAREDGETLKWQAQLAQKYGIYGFVFYHYWFGGTKLLDTPCKILLKHTEIPIRFSFCWDVSEWKRTWYTSGKNENEVLVAQDFGGKEMWELHFRDLEPFFKDDRYIKIDERPVFHIYRASVIPCFREMIDCWNRLALEAGYKGIYIVASNTNDTIKYDDVINAYYNFEPNHSFGSKRNKLYYKIIVWEKAKLIRGINGLFHLDLFEGKRSLRRVYSLINSEKITKDDKTYMGICPGYDDTPRRQKRGIVYAKSSPKLFCDSLTKLLIKSNALNKDFLYINAWNEWGEGAYLEPDERNGYEYLESVRDAVNNFGIIKG